MICALLANIIINISPFDVTFARYNNYQTEPKAWINDQKPDPFEILQKYCPPNPPRKLYGLVNNIDRVKYSNTLNKRRHMYIQKNCELAKEIFLEESKYNWKCIVLCGINNLMDDVYSSVFLDKTIKNKIE